jgi:hypothetical protein
MIRTHKLKTLCSLGDYFPVAIESAHIHFERVGVEPISFICHSARTSMCEQLSVKIAQNPDHFVQLDGLKHGKSTKHKALKYWG